ncbi:MFS transporter [Desulfobotulus sp. H1]|uniref:MFS transporter n=1 Tax=Desulfobotulus pelophilus TaxID=2823377 RepID=A0ABT3N9B0_9BACT|nr:MFS transporter [Desulfobotulus pelophilus]MCW7754020.1 MFS transporter [Desulfobotulus pelophilus]
MQPRFFKTTEKKTWPFSGNYFFYFLVLGIYFPFFPLYCHHIGFSEKEVGIISAVKTFTTVFFPLGWALLADRFRLQRSVFLLCHCTATLIWCAFFFTDSFVPMVLIMGAYGFFHSPVIGFTESFTVHFLGGNKTGYGKIRAWGSVGFILAVWSGGMLLDIWSSGMVLWLIGLGSMAGAMVAFGMPVSQNRGVRISRKDLQPFFSGNGSLFLWVCFLMLMSHGAYYGFFSIHLADAGFSGSFTGFAWALASFAEIGVMLASRRLFSFFPLKSLILFSFAVAVLRWTLLAFSLSASVILFSQLLHAVTYGVFHMTTILYMDQLVTSGAKTMGQTVLNASSYGLGLMAGYMVGGWGFAAMGSGMFLVSAGMALAGGAFAAALKASDQPIRSRA